MLKKLFGLAPQPTEDGAFTPSPLALRLATSARTDYDHTSYPNAYTDGQLKIMMICTEERNMPMANGKRFSTGNHPVEMLVPMLHFQQAGFEVEVFTPTGKSAKLEMWAFPEKDQAVQAIYRDYQKQLEQPKSLHDFVQTDMEAQLEYIAVFIPGGHGAMLGLPENKDLGKLIHWAEQRGLLMLSICHGPAALLAANQGKPSDGFIYRGYKMAAFPDSVDKQTPLIGYMPGQLSWHFGEKLKGLGVEIVNSKADKTCHQDRNLITGASPQAANAFGKLAAKALLEKVNGK
jgi:molecular chaperone Hsp31 and glyoxalase 3